MYDLVKLMLCDGNKKPSGTLRGHVWFGFKSIFLIVSRDLIDLRFGNVLFSHMVTCMESGEEYTQMSWWSFYVSSLCSSIALTLPFSGRNLKALVGILLCKPSSESQLSLSVDTVELIYRLAGQEPVRVRSWLWRSLLSPIAQRAAWFNKPNYCKMKFAWKFNRPTPSSQMFATNAVNTFTL